MSQKSSPIKETAPKLFVEQASLVSDSLIEIEELKNKKQHHPLSDEKPEKDSSFRDTIQRMQDNLLTKGGQQTNSRALTNQFQKTKSQAITVSHKFYQKRVNETYDAQVQLTNSSVDVIPGATCLSDNMSIKIMQVPENLQTMLSDRHNEDYAVSETNFVSPHRQQKNLNKSVQSILMKKASVNSLRSGGLQQTGKHVLENNSQSPDRSYISAFDSKSRGAASNRSRDTSYNLNLAQTGAQLISMKDQKLLS